MDTICGICDQDMVETKEPEYITTLMGIPVTVVNAVHVLECSCGEKEVVIPNLPGLNAAAALSRALMSEKLIGMEIKFLRKSIEYPAKELAKALGVTPETVSRWENDKVPMGITNEKLFRMMVAATLHEKAPAIDFDMKDVMSLDITGFVQPGKPVRMAFELVRFKSAKNKSSEEEYDPIAA